MTPENTDKGQTPAEADSQGHCALGDGSPPNHDEVIYATGCTPDGITLIGGVWTLHDQEGFPLEMSHLTCQQNGWRIDWMEAMADASRSNNCPALMKAVEAFLPGDAITHLKLGFMHMVRSGKSFDDIVEAKRANGRKYAAFIRAVAAHLSSANPGSQP